MNRLLHTRSGRRRSGWLGMVGVLVSSSCVAPPLPSNARSDPQIEQRARSLSAEGRYSEAAREYRRQAEAASLRGDRETKSRALVQAGESHLRAAERSLARVALTDALAALSGSPRDRSTALRGHTGLGDADFLDDYLDNARYHYQRALEYAQGTLQRDSVLKRLELLESSAGRGTEASRWREQLRMPDSSALAEISAALGSKRPADPDSWTDPELLSPDTGRRMPSVPTLLSRQDWSANRVERALDPMGRIWRMTVHHTAVRFTATDRSSAAKAIGGMQSYHMTEKHWADIGYHFLIDPAGRVWQGRELKYVGAHAGNEDLNRGNIGIALLGNFSEQPLPQAQATALLQWISMLGQQFQIRSQNIYSHQEIRPGPTDCPGRALAGFLSRLRKSSLSALLPPTPALIPPPSQSLDEDPMFGMDPPVTPLDWPPRSRERSGARRARRRRSRTRTTRIGPGAGIPESSAERGNPSTPPPPSR